MPCCRNVILKSRLRRLMLHSRNMIAMAAESWSLGSSWRWCALWNQGSTEGNYGAAAQVCCSDSFKLRMSSEDKATGPNHRRSFRDGGMSCRGRPRSKGWHGSCK